MPSPEPIPVEPFNPEDEGPEDDDDFLDEDVGPFEEGDEEDPEIEELLMDLILAVEENTRAVRVNTKYMNLLHKRFSAAGMFESGTEFFKMINGIRDMLKSKQAGG